MNDNGKKEKNKSKLYIGLAVIIIFIQVATFLFFFIQKQEFHGDEMWCFGIANNQGTPHFYRDDKWDIIHFDEWLDGKVVHDYLTVQKDERFDYSNVINNSRIDTGQPLYFMILHTICSVFPDTFSYWYSASVQIIVVIISSFFLFLSLDELGVSKPLTIAGLTMFAFSSGGIDLALYLRQYAMFVMFCNIALYLHIKVFKADQIKWGICFALAICNIGGTLTHMYYWTYAFILGVITFFGLLFVKSFRKLLKYCIGMFSGVCISLLIFPYLFSRVGIHTEHVGRGNFTVKQQVMMSFRLLLRALTGMGPSGYYDTVYKEIGIVLLFVIIVFLLPLCFLFRHENWFVSSISKAKDQLYKAGGYIKQRWQIVIVCLALVVEVIVHVIINASILDFGQQNATTIRYLFGCIPLVLILFVVIVDFLTGTIGSKKVICRIFGVLLVLGLTVFSNISRPHIYAGSKNSEGITLNDIEDSDIVLLFNMQSELQCVVGCIAPSNCIINSLYKDVDENIDKIASYRKDRPLYVVAGNDWQYYGNKFAKSSEILTSQKNMTPEEYQDALVKFILEERTELNSKLMKACGREEAKEIGQEKTLNFAYRLIKLE
ncbi:MAG: hypothetical protein IKQ71_08740 [Lachnospiraceae bacterium]|nr:hypothetical protein [Lachnospiraceae bacterium]